MVAPSADAAVPRTVVEAGHWLHDHRTSSVALTRLAIARGRALQPTLEAFNTISEGPALEAAAQADAELATGVDRGPLHGIPFAVKDNIATADAPTTASTKTLGRWWPGRDATVVARLRQAGAVIVGKSALDELAFAPPEPDSGFPRPRNPWDVGRTPGGSSSGTAVAIASGIVLGGLGSDTGGSIRLPAAHCGVSGLQPSFGRVSLHGVVPGAWSLDVVGPMARSARDCALLFHAIAGHDAADMASIDVPVPEPLEDGVGVEGLRIGLPRSGPFALAELEPEVARAVLKAVDVLASAGAEIVEIEIPYLDAAHAAYWVTLLSEGYAYHENGLRRRPTRYGTSVRRTLVAGCLFTGADYVHARRVGAIARARYLEIFRSVDAIVMPGSLYVAPLLENWVTTTRMFTRPSLYALSTIVGAPALAVPCGLSHDGLPIGMQVLARPFDEQTTLRVGQTYQRLTDWHLRSPALSMEAK